MRISRSRIRARVKDELPITFSDEAISARGGLELLRRYLAAIDLPGRLRALFRDTELDGDFGLDGSRPRFNRSTQHSR